jgi:hypothetical protein
MISANRLLKLIHPYLKANKRMSRTYSETCFSFMKRFSLSKRKSKIASRNSLKCILNSVKYTWKVKLKISKLFSKSMLNLSNPMSNLIWKLESWKNSFKLTKKEKLEMFVFLSLTKIEILTCPWRKVFDHLKKKRKRLKNKRVQYQKRWKLTFRKSTVQ